MKVSSLKGFISRIVSPSPVFDGKIKFLAVVLGAIAAFTPAAAQSPLAAGPPGIALNNSQVLSVALPITNTSTAALSSVTVTPAQFGSECGL